MTSRTDDALESPARAVIAIVDDDDGNDNDDDDDDNDDNDDDNDDLDDYEDDDDRARGEEEFNISLRTGTIMATYRDFLSLGQQ